MKSRHAKEGLWGKEEPLTGIEGTISAMKRTGLNCIRVCRLVRVRMDVMFNAIGCNLKRLFRVCPNKRIHKNKPPLLLNHIA